MRRPLLLRTCVFLSFRQGQHSRRDRLILQHAPKNQRPKRRRQDSSAVCAHVKCVLCNRLPPVAMQFKRKRYRRNLGGLAVVTQTFEVVRIGGAPREHNPMFLFASARPPATMPKRPGPGWGGSLLHSILFGSLRSILPIQHSSDAIYELLPSVFFLAPST